MGDITYKDRNYDSVQREKYIELRKHCKNFDFTIHVAENRYPVHQEILKRSRYFDTLLKSDYVESQSQTMTFKTDIIPTNIMEILLDYYYTRELCLNEEIIENVVQAAMYLDDGEILNHCISYYQTILDISNVLNIYESATYYNHKQLEECVLSYLFTNFETFVSSDQLQSTPKILISQLVSSTELVVKNERVVLKAICDWLTSDGSKKNKYVEELFSKLNFKNLAHDNYKLVHAPFLSNANLQLIFKSKFEPYLSGKNELDLSGSTATRRYYGGIYVIKHTHGVSGVYRYTPDTNEYDIMTQVGLNCIRNVIKYKENLYIVDHLSFLVSNPEDRQVINFIRGHG